MKNELKAGFDIGNIEYITDTDVAEGTLWAIDQIRHEIEDFKSPHVLPKQKRNALGHLDGSLIYYATAMGDIISQEGALCVPQISGRLISHLDVDLGQRFFDLGYLLGKTFLGKAIGDDFSIPRFSTTTTDVYRQLGVWNAEWRDTKHDTWEFLEMMGPGPRSYGQVLGWLLNHPAF